MATNTSKCAPSRTSLRLYAREKSDNSPGSASGPNTTSRLEAALVGAIGPHEQAFKRSAELDARRVDVRVDGGKVSLYGSVRSWMEKDGVVAVDDRIVVSL